MVERRVERRVPTVFLDWLQYTVTDVLIYAKWRLMTAVFMKVPSCFSISFDSLSKKSTLLTIPALPRADPTLVPGEMKVGVELIKPETLRRNGDVGNETLGATQYL